MDLEQLQALICQNIGEARKRRGLTQEDLNVEDEGIGVATIRRIETLQLTNIELTTLLRLSRLLKVHPRDFFDIEVPWETQPLPREEPKRKRKRRI